MRTIFLLLASIIMLTNTSCKKCKVCECTKNGATTEKKNCAYGGGSSNQSLETWETYLRENGGYDSVTCHDEK